MSNWITRTKKEILHMGRWLSVESHEVELPDGQVIPDWSWVITPDTINVLAITEDGQAVVFRQEKYGLEGFSLAPVGGYIEPGEEPLEAAKRELLEETGYVAETWVPLGSYRVDPNRGVAMSNLFLARGARKVAEPTGGDLEEQQLLHMPLPDLRAALARGEFKVLAWAAAIAFALLHLE